MSIPHLKNIIIILILVLTFVQCAHAEPFITAIASPSNVTKGDNVYITGTAQGDISSVNIWIFGNEYHSDSATVEITDLFEYEIDTAGMVSGKYYVIIQHPMNNYVFDVRESTTYLPGKTVIFNEIAGEISDYFIAEGEGSLQGLDAFMAMTQLLNDPNIDDIYTKIEFRVNDPPKDILVIDLMDDGVVTDTELIQVVMWWFESDVSDDKLIQCIMIWFES